MSIRRRDPAKLLLVEGPTEQRLVPELMRANGAAWDDDAVGVDVPLIKDLGGVRNILKRGAISSEARASGLQSLGIIVDANGDVFQRWTAIKNRCSDELPDLPPMPDQIPSNGLVCPRPDGSMFGVRILPDNQHQGALEHFLLNLVPSDAAGLLELARESVQAARAIGAPVRDHDVTKSTAHTWLAWQENPGLQLHIAVKNRVLDANHPESAPFVSWFQRLFSN